jgi:hypothetical protein
MSKPKIKIKAGQFEATVWDNVVEKAGKKFVIENVGLRKSWKQGDEWKENKTTMTPNDIAKVILLLQEVQRQLFLKGEEKELQQPEQQGLVKVEEIE